MYKGLYYRTGLAEANGGCEGRQRAPVSRFELLRGFWGPGDGLNVLAVVGRRASADRSSLPLHFLDPLDLHLHLSQSFPCNSPTLLRFLPLLARSCSLASASNPPNCFHCGLDPPKNPGFPEATSRLLERIGLTGPSPTRILPSAKVERTSGK